MTIEGERIERIKRAEREYDDEIIGDGTVIELFERSTERVGDVDAQWYKGGICDRSLAPDVIDPAPEGEYDGITYRRMGEIVRRLATGFRELGVTAGDRVAIYAQTRMEWAQCDYALLASGAVPTTVYTESSPRQINYLVNHPGAIGIVCENEELLDDVVRINTHLTIDFAVVFDDLEKYVDVDNIYSLAEVYELGDEAFDRSQYDEWVAALAPDDLASIIYTSGTTGIPKGVKLTHRNFRANINQIWRRSGPRPDKDEDVPALTEKTRTISFLPLAHVFERTVGHFLMFSFGGTVGYAESPDTVGDDLLKIRPTAATSVPRVYERVYDQMRDEASGNPISERIFEWAVEVARTEATTEDPGLAHRLRYAIADWLVYSTVREELGGNAEYLVSGGGTLNEDLSQLFHSMGLPIYEGYGMTEAAPVVSSGLPETPQPGTLGIPNTGLDVRFRSIDTGVGDDVEGEVGELEVKGPNVFDGYWKMPEETEAAFTDDGYFKTGDIVRRRPDDHLVYQDRRKNVLVLSTGKNVSPERIETEFATSELIEQIMVVGDDRKFVGALVVPNFEAVREWADQREVDLPDGEAAICEEERVREWINEEIQLVNRNFSEDERIKQFELVATEWTPETGLLTPSLKKKRNEILDACADAVAAVYDEEPTSNRASGATARE